jgi:hypothetical protein
MSLSWCKDIKIEKALRSLGIHFEAEKVNLDDVDLAEGLRKQTRLLGKLNQDYVLQLAEAMMQPEAAFPMTILQKTPRQKLFSWSGNHRLAAYVLAFPNEKIIEAYTVNISKDVVMCDILPRIVNSYESGLGFSKEEKLINARWLVEHHSMKIQDAAKLVGVPYKWLETSKRAEDIKAELLPDLGAKANGISKSILLKMSPLTDNLNVLKATAKVLCQYEVKGDEANHLLEDVKAHRTELQQMSELGRWERIFQDRKKPEVPKGQAPKIQIRFDTRKSFLKHVTGLAKILQTCDTFEKLQCTDLSDRELIAKSWVTIARTMDKLQKQGGAA